MRAWRAALEFIRRQGSRCDRIDDTSTSGRSRIGIAATGTRSCRPDRCAGRDPEVEQVVAVSPAWPATVAATMRVVRVLQ
ncbi:MAG: hypothetical protein DMF89_22675 [Acidobacteria bacterium]|nr:MAG: hypothetical protein DMF89_22675 [Acidobacteriota bacterium]